MKTLRQILKETAEKKIAIGHFNISDLVTLEAIFRAAESLSSPRKKIPILIGTSEGEREFVGLENAVSLIKNIRKKYKWPIYLNADHTHSVEKAKAAIDTGYDEVLFDGGKLSLEENIRQTKEVVAYARASGKDVVIEGELGYIGSSSEILEKIPEGAAIEEKDLTTPEDAARFVRETGVDMLAPAVGNFHGLVGTAPKTTVNIARIKVIKEAVKIPLVLHGGSGTPDADFLKAIEAGINVIHISTELRVAWRHGMEESLKNHPHEVAPYKLMESLAAAVKEAVKKHLTLFNRRS